MIFTNNPHSDIPDFYQSAAIVLGRDKQQTENEFPFKRGLLFNKNPSHKMIKEKANLSEILVEMGMVLSKKEFFRKLKERAIKYCGKPLESDMQINASEPSISHEIRIGKRFLEVVVPFRMSSFEFFISKVERMFFCG